MTRSAPPSRPHGAADGRAAVVCRARCRVLARRALASRLLAGRALASRILAGRALASRILASRTALVCAALVCCAALACNPPAAHDPAVATPRAPSPPPPDCDDPPAAVLTFLSDKTCPWVLYQEAGELALRPLTPGARATPALVPEECRPCRYTGVVTAAGPVVLAVRVPPGSELADAAWIGAATDGEPLAFAPLWYDRPVLGDSTLQGPAWALAPHVCGKSLALWPVPRLPGATAEEPSAALLAAAGVYAPQRGELARQGDPVPSDRSACTPVPLELP